MLELLFNAAMLAVDALLLRWMWRRKSPDTALLALAAAGLAILLLAGLGEAQARAFTLFGPLFTFLGLLAWGVFVHLPLLGLGATACLWHRVRWLSRLTLGAALGTWLLGVYAFGIEPTWLEVTRYEVVSPKVAEPLRIVVVADLQTDHIGAYERRALAAAVAARPDLLLLPGDYLHTKTEAEFRALRLDLMRLFEELDFHAPLGLLAVRGNVDHNEWESLFEEVPGAHTFPATGEWTSPGLTVTALDLEDSFRADLVVPPRPGFHIVFGHGPDFALGNVQADLLIAGHTHGGQVRLPGFGPPMTLSRVPRAWTSGRTELPGGRTLIVSRGIGMERGYAPRLRFLCRPELVVVDLLPAEE